MGTVRRVARRLMVPRLHVVVSDPVADRADFEAAASALRRRCRGGLALHLRLRDTPARTQHRLARRLRKEAEFHGGWCVVNSRVDVALTAGAHAVQLGAGALPTGAARRILGPGVPIGRSVHGLEEARRAAAGGANYLLTGTIYATPSHPDRAGAGPELVRRCAAAVDVPVVAIGGVDAARAGEIRRAGAHGAAVIRAVWEAADPPAAAVGLLRALDGTAGGAGRE